jgi:hypothetical protein
MNDQTTELLRAKRGVAILATCIVQTLNESDPGFQDRFLERLSRAYRELKDNTPGDVIQEMELLSWTRSYLTGFDFVKGQGEPFLGGA